MSRVEELTRFRDYEKFLMNNERCVVFYGAKWCEACNDIYPLYERIANRYYEKAGFAYCDIDKAKLEFDSIPVLLSFWKGKQVDHMVGSSIDNMKELIKNVIICTSYPYDSQDDNNGSNNNSDDEKTSEDSESYANKMSHKNMNIKNMREIHDSDEPPKNNKKNMEHVAMKQQSKHSDQPGVKHTRKQETKHTKKQDKKQDNKHYDKQNDQNNKYNRRQDKNIDEQKQYNHKKETPKHKQEQKEPPKESHTKTHHRHHKHHSNNHNRKESDTNILEMMNKK
jgi:hypothetical protein